MMMELHVCCVSDVRATSVIMVSSLLILCDTHAHASTPALSPISLRVEYQDSPITVDSRMPRFSWGLTSSQRGTYQRSYQLIVKSVMGSRRGDGIISESTVVWDSGVVQSNRTLNVPFGGTGNSPQPLTSDSDYQWTVTCFDGKTGESTSEVGRFSTAILETHDGTLDSAGSQDWYGAEWVSSAENGSLDTYRTQFTVSDMPIRARLYISGLGYAKSWLNGDSTDDHELGQFTTFQERVLYDCVDVTNLLRPGVNVLGIMVGVGWFGAPNIHAGPRQFMLLLSVSTANSTVYFRSSASNSDNKVEGDSIPLIFKATNGPVTYQGTGPGERYDGRIALAIDGWNTADFIVSQRWKDTEKPIVSPNTFGSKITAHTVAIITDADYIPLSINEPDPIGHPGVYVADFGQNMAGQVSLNVKNCKAGHNISLQHTEILYPNGLAHDSFCERPKYWMCNTVQFANFTCGGAAFENYRVTFEYMGFRYVQIVGYPGRPSNLDITAHFIHANLSKTGNFVSSNTLLNQIQHATRYAGLSNAMDIPTDCPQREKQGWLGDAQLAFDTMVHNFDMGAFYAKWIRDLGDSQLYNNATLGSDMGFGECAPFYGHGNLEADPGWGIAAWNVPMGFASYFDDELLEKSWYSHSKAYLEHWIKLANNNGGILQLTKEGDWGNLDNINGFPGFKFPSYSQFFYIHALDSQVNLASRLGNANDVTRYSQLADQARKVYLTTFYNPNSSCYGNCSDIEQIFGLSAGLHPSDSSDERRAWAHAMSWFGSSGKNSERFGGGIIGLKLVYPLLDKFGLSDLGLKFQLHGDRPPSFGYWMNQNATTLWEYWSNSATTFNSGLNSYNHIMYGGSGNWYYSTLAGIQRVPGSRSWSDLVISPPAGGILDQLDWANASIETPMGIISSAWRAIHQGASNKYGLHLTIPPNSRAKLVLPTILSPSSVVIYEENTLIWHRGQYINGTDGIRSGVASSSANVVVFSIASGTYNFLSMPNLAKKAQLGDIPVL